MTKSASRNYMSHGLNKRSRDLRYTGSAIRMTNCRLHTQLVAGKRQLLLCGLTMPRLIAMQLVGNK